MLLLLSNFKVLTIVRLRHTDTQTHRDTDTQRDTDRHRETHTHRHTHRHIDAGTHLRLQELDGPKKRFSAQVIRDKAHLPEAEGRARSYL